MFVRYESEGFADSGIQFCVTHPNGGIVRSGIEYQLKTGAIGDGWALPGVSISRCGEGLAVTVDGKPAARRADLGRLVVDLSPKRARTRHN